jgi:acetyl-CoA acetyltransferase
MTSRVWAATAPGAQRPEPMSYDDYLAAPIVATPLRSVDCCLISDGAGAYVVTSLERARSLAKRPVVVAGVGFAALPQTTVGLFSQHTDLTQLGADRSGARAYRDAGLGPSDVDVAEVYDCFTISVIIQLEQLGFCGRGEGAAFVAEGHIGPGGSLPMNTNGGHLAYAYIPGINHVVEAVRQLRRERGEGQAGEPEVALVAGLGGSDHATALLTVDR